MNKRKITLENITIRKQFRPGDIGYITFLHGAMYHKEYDHGIEFEAYVASGLADLYHNYDPRKDCAWICDHDGAIIGSLFLQHKEEGAQLRYFLIHPEYQGIGLGKKLMELYMNFLLKSGYRSSFLWTTNELHAASSLYKRYGFTLAKEVPSTRFGKSVIEQKYVWST